jgi:hypothetical protein
MTCEECYTLMLTREPTEATTAEFSAVIRHLKGCPHCPAKLGNQCTEIRKEIGEEKVRKLQSQLSEKEIERKVAKVLMDPEA